ncbi:MAG: hypothetical protein ABFC57_17610 [Veillonellales bacterium]
MMQTAAESRRVMKAGAGSLPLPHPGEFQLTGILHTANVFCMQIGGNAAGR